MKQLIHHVLISLSHTYSEGDKERDSTLVCQQSELHSFSESIFPINMPDSQLCSLTEQQRTQHNTHLLPCLASQVSHDREADAG